MARMDATKFAVLEILTDGLHVQSMTLDGEELPLRHILGYTVTGQAMDVPTVTVTFLARPVIRPADDSVPSDMVAPV